VKNDDNPFNEGKLVGEERVKDQADTEYDLDEQGAMLCFGDV
jgi:hypothetical protein